METTPEITYCTPVKGRLAHLQATLPNNLVSCPDAHFVILNYSDQTGLHEWMTGFLDALPDQDRARVKYVRHEGAIGYDHSLAKNIAHKQADTQWVCNLDADNRMPPEAHQKLTEAIRQRGPAVYTCQHSPGLVCLPMQIFEAIGGYDEDLLGWGCEDSDIVCRAEGLGHIHYAITMPGLSRMEHGDNLRMANIGGHKLQSLTKQRGIHFTNLRKHKYIANQGREWGILNPPPYILDNDCNPRLSESPTGNH